MTKTLKVTNESPKDLARMIQKEASNGNEILLIIEDRKVQPEQVIKIISTTIGKHDVELMIYHPEIKDYLNNALAGGSIGAGAATAITTVLTLLRLGSPIGWAQIIATGVLGAIIGAIIGMGTTSIASIKISKTWLGKTEIKFIPAS